MHKVLLLRDCSIWAEKRPYISLLSFKISWFILTLSSAFGSEGKTLTFASRVNCLFPYRFLSKVFPIWTKRGSTADASGISGAPPCTSLDHFRPSPLIYKFRLQLLRSTSLAYPLKKKLRKYILREREKESPETCVYTVDGSQEMALEITSIPAVERSFIAQHQPYPCSLVDSDTCLTVCVGVCATSVCI